jgi:hypothetical protein
MTGLLFKSRRIGLVASLVVVAVASLMLTACASSNGKDPADAARDRQNQLLLNPMADPTMGDPDLNGGGIGDYHDQSMKRDLNDVFN